MLSLYDTSYLLRGVLGILGFGFLAIVAKYVVAARRHKGFPPGPSTLPLIGNLHQINPTKVHLQCRDWQKEHGSILGLKFGPQDVVVLNSWKHVRDLVDRKGAIYASRPENFVANDLLFPDGGHILVQPYGPAWRALRRTMHALLNANAVENLLPIQNAEASQTVYQILTDPTDFYEHIRGYAAGVILGAVYGQQRDSRKIQASFELSDRFTQLIQPGYCPPVDDFPILKYLPDSLAWWAREAKDLHRCMVNVYGELMHDTKERMAKGIRKGCFMERMLDEQKRFGLTERQVLHTGEAFLEAGSETMSASIQSFLLACAKWPHVLKKCQEEVDAVCGDKRSPNAGDVNKLHYITACMLEVLRWRPPAPLGIPHVLTEDDVYGEYRFRKGTIVIINVWAIERDADEFDQPDDFMPERYLNSKYGTKPGHDASEGDDFRRVSYGFGAGRRVCPGEKTAKNSLIVNIAKLCWAFDMASKGPVDVNVETAYTVGITVKPHPFPLDITPRSKVHAAVIEKDWQEASAYLDQYRDLDLSTKEAA